MQVCADAGAAQLLDSDGDQVHPIYQHVSTWQLHNILSGGGSCQPLCLPEITDQLH